MRKFNTEYPLLKEMYANDYYPDFLVDKIRDEIRKVIAFLETGVTDTEQIQEKFDSMTIAFNELEEEFEEHDSELESIARDTIAADVIKQFYYI